MQAKPAERHTKTNVKLTTDRFKNITHLCAYCCAQLSYTTQHGILIIFPLNIQKIAENESV